MMGGINSESALGHAGLSTTQIYTQVSVHQLKAIHTATHPGKPIGKWGTHSGEKK